MPVHVPARPDRSLALKRRVFTGMYRLGSIPAVKRMAAAWMRPDHPPLALALGECLVKAPRRVLALTAHPDDLEFFAGGTLRRMALAGSRIFAVVMSDGEKRGNWADLGAERRLEQQEAARLQGYAAVQFMGLPDFGLPEDPRLEHLVARAWDRVSPEVVFTFDPKELIPHMANRDHKALGRTVMDLARDRLDSGTRVYFYGTQHPDVLVDIGPVMAEKRRLVTAHRSQMVYLSGEDTEGTINLMAAIAAQGSGCEYAEPLYRLM